MGGGLTQAQIQKAGSTGVKDIIKIIISEEINDMYPLYWILSKGGIFMRYSYEFKMKAIELFYQGEWPETPNGVSPHSFHAQIRYWAKQEELHGPDINKFYGEKRIGLQRINMSSYVKY